MAAWAAHGTKLFVLIWIPSVGDEQGCLNSALYAFCDNRPAPTVPAPQLGSTGANVEAMQGRVPALRHS
jgi:hypothetical protein